MFLNNPKIPLGKIKKPMSIARDKSGHQTAKHKRNFFANNADKGIKGSISNSRRTRANPFIPIDSEFSGSQRSSLKKEQSMSPNLNK